MRRLGVAVCVLLGRRHCTRSQDAVGTHVGVRSRRTVASGATGRRITAIFALLTVVLTVGAASCRAPPFGSIFGAVYGVAMPLTLHWHRWCIFFCGTTVSSAAATVFYSGDYMLLDVVLVGNQGSTVAQQWVITQHTPSASIVSIDNALRIDARAVL